MTAMVQNCLRSARKNEKNKEKMKKMDIVSENTEIKDKNAMENGKRCSA